VAYNTMIDTQARVGAMDEVRERLDSMKADGVEPDSISMSTCIKGYCIKGDLDMASSVLQRMKANGMVKDSIVYNTILDGCVRHAEFDRADATIADMENYGISPTNFTLGIIVKMYGRRKQLEKAFEAVATFPRKYGFQINSSVQSCLIASCLGCQAPNMVMEVLRQMQTVDFKTYNMAISGFVRFGRLADAVGLVEGAYGLDNKPRRLPMGQSIDVEHLEKLVVALGRDRSASHLAMPLVYKLRAAGSVLPARVCASLLDGKVGEGRENTQASAAAATLRQWP